MTAVLSGGSATHDLLGPRDRYGPSQVFITFGIDKLDAGSYAGRLADEVVEFVHSAVHAIKDGTVYYPGERTLMTRRENLEKGIPVNEEIWKRICER